MPYIMKRPGAKPDPKWITVLDMVTTGLAYIACGVMICILAMFNWNC